MNPDPADTAADPDPFRDPFPTRWCDVPSAVEIAAASVADNPETETMRDAGLTSRPEPGYGVWHPIETAPRNGELIIGAWRAGKGMWAECAILRWNGRKWTDAKSGAVLNPTHWTPIPPPDALP